MKRDIPSELGLENREWGIIILLNFGVRILIISH
jgi:hypothetical protein